MPQQKSSWLARNWGWLIPIGCLGLLALVAVFGGAIFLLVTSLLRSSDIYRETLHRAEKDPRVVAALGSPIEAGWWISGRIETSGPSGEADVAIPVSGPRGSARIYAVAEKRAGRWRFETLLVRTAEGQEIDLLGPATPVTPTPLLEEPRPGRG
jgi:hypothetical protein